MDDNRFDNLTYLIASLREKFPFGKDVDLAEIIHSPEWCLEAMIRECGWRPIETAPKNGESILLCRSGFIPLVGLFNESLGWVDFDEDDKSLRDLWIEEGTEFAHTHWMPLPQPPAGSP